MPPSNRPQPASYEEYDSDVGRVKANSRVEARCPPAAHSTSAARTVALRQKSASSTTKKLSKDAASDSGYSSHTSNTRGSDGPAPARYPEHPSAVPATARSSKSASPIKTRPAMPYLDTHQDRLRYAERPPTSSKPTSPCTDPYCRDPACSTVRQTAHSARAESAAPAYYAQYQPPIYSYAQPLEAPPYSYTPVQAPVPSSPILPQPRPRSGSIARARPVSVHGYSFPSSGGNYHGPPPSQSAYMSAQYAALTRPYGMDLSRPQATYYDSTSMLPPASLYAPSPTPPSPTMSRADGSSRNFSARVTNPDVPGYVTRPPPQIAAPLTRTPSARQQTRRPSITHYYNEPASDGESTSGSDSDSQPTEAIYESSRRPRKDSQHARPSASSILRRPSLRTRYITEPAEGSHRLSRELPYRTFATEDQLSSSDNMDSDRTAKAVVDRRVAQTGPSRTSRRPSVSASGRVHDDHPSREASLLDRAAAYQAATSGVTPIELTAENIRRQQRRSTAGAASRSSRQSNSSKRGPGVASSSKQGGGGEGVRIHAGDTVLHIYGETSIAVKPSTEDGGPAQLVIGTHSSGTSGRRSEAGVGERRDSTYYSSQKSGSTRRSGASRESGSRGKRRDTVLDG